MQSKKILVASISLLLVGLAVSVSSLPKATAFLISPGGNPANGVSITLGGSLRSFSPPSGGTVDAVQTSTTLPVTVTFQASSFTPAYVRNVTVGFEGDWMTTYTNASILSLTTSQIGSVTISVALPSAGGIKPVHTWTVQLWDGPASGFVANCVSGNGENNAAGSKSCFTITNVHGPRRRRDERLHRRDDPHGRRNCNVWYRRIASGHRRLLLSEAQTEGINSQYSPVFPRGILFFKDKSRSVLVIRVSPSRS